MMELVVISGKGGTGKTSMVGSLASLSRDKVLVDCDVDAADLHLILQNKVQKTTEFIGGKQASIDEDKCTNCGICQDYCRFDAIKNESQSDNEYKERYWIDKHACDGCGVCVRHCPEDAIDFKEVVSGEWYISDTPYGPLAHARLGIAQANSGKLVSELRQQAKQLADQRGLDLILIDGPPGIGCPVIASITGVGYVLIVTEPSMSALHDMERLLKLTVHFRIPTGICINKYDINLALTARIEDFAKEQNVKILGRIPFDPTVTKAQMAGTSIIEHNDNGASNSIKKLWSNLNAEFKEKG
ncbi:MAG: ATP-binding protein [candidate division Zixibacteria bacterium]|nr:ATP-binding protein [candidate division Zixibacteria bacterium]